MTLIIDILMALRKVVCSIVYANRTKEEKI